MAALRIVGVFILVVLSISDSDSDSESFRPCDGEKTSKDAIFILGQKTHSSYDSSHSSSLMPVLTSLTKYYNAANKADVLVWHEGDLKREDIPTGLGYNVRLCNLWMSRGAWGPPTFFNQYEYDGLFKIGYKFMIRLYAVTIWKLLYRLGYEWMIRFDDDSEIHSTISYNLFDFMRSQNKTYGFRQFAQECGWGGNRFDKFVTNYFTRTHNYNYKKSYCQDIGKYGYYNNFYISQVAWWMEPEVNAFLQAFDRSQLIFTHRDNDLIFQTATIKNLLPPSQRHHFIDWSYHHHTIKNNALVYGGIDIGTLDTNGTGTLTQYVYDYGHFANSKIEKRKTCKIFDSICPNKASSCEILHTQMFAAPACAHGEPTPLPKQK